MSLLSVEGIFIKSVVAGSYFLPKFWSHFEYMLCFDIPFSLSHHTDVSASSIPLVLSQLFIIMRSFCFPCEGKCQGLVFVVSKLLVSFQQDLSLEQKKKCLYCLLHLQSAGQRWSQCLAVFSYETSTSVNWAVGLIEQLIDLVSTQSSALTYDSKQLSACGNGHTPVNSLD